MIPRLRPFKRGLWVVLRKLCAVAPLVGLLVILLKLTILGDSSATNAPSGKEAIAITGAPWRASSHTVSASITDGRRRGPFTQADSNPQQAPIPSDEIEQGGNVLNALYYPNISQTPRAKEEKVAPPTASFEDDVQQRARAYTASCSQMNAASATRDLASVIASDPDTKMAYCFVAKIACTFWLRIFSFLTRPADMEKRGYRAPSEIDRAALHWGELLPKPFLKYQQMRALFKPDTLKFFFTRNPYERLWSVYLDKYYLPDYWVAYPLGASRCGENTTFGQFLNHAVTSQDHHLTPVSQACNPCLFKPDVVGKMETFARDAKHILNQTGYGRFLENYNHTSYVQTELTSLITYNFRLLTAHHLEVSKCLNPKSLSRRLWKVFQINGHIRLDSPFPDTLSDYSLQNVIEVFLKLVARDPLDKEESKRQRRDALVEAYADISPSLVIDIQERYRLDFEMFEYSVDPPT